MTTATELELMRSEMLAALGRIEGKLDGYIVSHTTQHVAEQQAFYDHKLEAAVPMAEFLGPPKITDRVRSLEDASLAQTTAFRTLRGMLVVVTGGSLVSAAGFFVLLWRTLS